MPLLTHQSPNAQAMQEELLITVIEGRDLAPKDSNGFADPFVVIKLGKMKHVTGIVYKSLNPVFAKESYSCVIDAAHNTLKIQCWDRDPVKNDFMGKIEIPVHEIQAEIKYKYHMGNGHIQRWYQLKPRHKLHIDGPITGDLLLKFEIIGSELMLVKAPSGPVQVETQLIAPLQQMHLEPGALHTLCTTIHANENLQISCVRHGILPLLKMQLLLIVGNHGTLHMHTHAPNDSRLEMILRLLAVLATVADGKDQMVELGFVNALNDVAKFYKSERANNSMYVAWSRVLVNLCTFPKLKIINTANFPFFMKLLDSEDTQIQENILSLILGNGGNSLVDVGLQCNVLLDSMENMLANGAVTVQRLCMKILVLFSSKKSYKVKLIGFIEPMMKILREETTADDMTDDILLILLNLSDQASARVFIFEEGMSALEGISSCGSPTQRETTIEILKQINSRDLL